MSTKSCCRWYLALMSITLGMAAPAQAEEAAKPVDTSSSQPVAPVAVTAPPTEEDEETPSEQAAPLSAMWGAPTPGEPDAVRASGTRQPQNQRPEAPGGRGSMDGDVDEERGQQPRARLSGLVLRSFGGALSAGGGSLSLSDAGLRQGIQIDAAVALSVRVAFLKVLFVDMGFAPMFLTDVTPLRVEVCSNTFGQSCQLIDSTAEGATTHIKAGFVGRIFVPIGANTWQFAVLPAVGHRGLHVERMFTQKCVNCPSPSVALHGGPFLSPELDVSLSTDGRTALVAASGIKVEYEHHLTGDIDSAFWVSVFVEVM